MSTNPGKDFDQIAEDYTFFERHATEAQEDARAYQRQLAKIIPEVSTIRMLDFGCGSGTFTERLLKATGWAPQRLRLVLVEPAQVVRSQAVARLAAFTDAPIADSSDFSNIHNGGFDVVLSNHVFYYVSDLRGAIGRLIGALAPTGVFLTAIAARTNTLIEFWIAGFGSIGREIPYRTAEDVEAALQELGANYQKQQVPYELAFSDTEENRMRIIRFLLADHLAQIPVRPLLDRFDQYSHAGRIEIRTASDHFTIRGAANAARKFGSLS